MEGLPFRRAIFLPTFFLIRTDSCSPLAVHFHIYHDL
jgi:hypothetical protein